MENAPCTIQESLACGTPVAAFAVGGIPEMVVPEKTGFLAGRVGAESLEKKLTHALADPARLQQIRRECRTAAEQVWDPDALAESF
jgi:glycosyltransferase involved in cell wall biosynthesis